MLVCRSGCHPWTYLPRDDVPDVWGEATLVDGLGERRRGAGPVRGRPGWTVVPQPPYWLASYEDPQGRVVVRAVGRLGPGDALDDRMVLGHLGAAEVLDGTLMSAALAGELRGDALDYAATQRPVAGLFTVLQGKVIRYLEQ